MELIYLLLGLLIGVVGLQSYKKLLKAKVKDRWANEKRIYNLVESSKDIIYYYEIKPERKFRYLSPSIDKILGEGLVSESYRNPNTPLELVHPDDYQIIINKFSGKLDYNEPILQRWRDSQGNYIWFEEYATPIFEEGVCVAIQGIIRNIDEKVKLQENLEYRIAHDSLTGIYNRSYFDEQMGKYNKAVDTPVSVILCDLDELKVLNDTYGHKTGDLLIKEAAHILNQFSNNKTVVARIGGDEFAILLETDVGSPTYASQLVNDIKKHIYLYNLESDALKIKVSIGFSHSASSIGQMSKLFVTADAKMYQEKNQKRELQLEGQKN
jgi:diguanylate cyclase (GGDEF)-like protein/PAS domain S-box-containing protein